jgi:hypothetical protein
LVFDWLVMAPCGGTQQTWAPFFSSQPGLSTGTEEKNGFSAPPGLLRTTGSHQNLPKRGGFRVRTGLIFVARMRADLRVALVLVVSSVATLLALTAEAAPRTIMIPRTLTTTSVLDPDSGGGRVTLSVPPTHLGFSWRGADGTGIRYRTVSATGGTSRWRRATEATDLQAGNKHYSSVLTADRPEAIQWKPITRGKWMGVVRLDGINTLDGEPREVTAPEVSTARAGTPDVVTRGQWGADESLKRTSGGCKRRFFRVQQLFVHHTAGSNSESNPKATMRAIYWFHAVRRGWCDIGYNFVIDRKGTIYEGRWARSYKPWEVHSSENLNAKAVSGAHASGFNSGSVGVSLMGNYETSPIPPEMRRSLAELLAWEVDRHNLKPLAKHTYRNPETGLKRRLPYIAGHRDAGETACPGRFVYSALPGIRRDVKAIMGAGKLSSSMTFTDSPLTIGYGDTAVLTGILTDELGAPLSARTITLYKKTGSESWAVNSEATTGSDGVFSFALTPTANKKVFAVYDGDATTWGVGSGNVVIKVRPDITLVPEGAAPDPTGIYRYPEGTIAVTLSGTLNPPHVGRSVTVKVKRLISGATYETLVKTSVALGSGGVYSYTFSVPDGVGTYRATSWFPKDSNHAYSPSLPVDFVVGTG